MQKFKTVDKITFTNAQFYAIIIVSGASESPTILLLTVPSENLIMKLTKSLRPPIRQERKST